MEPRTEQSLLIVFADLTRYQVNARRTPNVELAELMHAYYERASQLVAESGGRIVKFMGDAFLAVWSEEASGGGAAALIALKSGLDAWWASKSWDSRLVVKAHFGRAVAGVFGDRFDVIGSEVNIAATLPARTIALSPEAFRRLDENDRRAFKKHTPQVIYIPCDDARP